MRKCCENGQNLNLRAGVCVDDGARKWEDPQVYVAGDGGQLVKSKTGNGNAILLDDVIRKVAEPKKLSCLEN